MDTSPPEMRPNSSSSSQARVGFVGVQHGSLSISEYEIRFLEWAKHISVLYPSEHDMVCGFIRRLVLPLCLVSEYFIVDGSSFSHFNYYMRDTKKICIQTYGVGGKRTYHQYSVISIPPGSEDLLDRGQLYLQLIDSMQVAFQAMVTTNQSW